MVIILHRTTIAHVYPLAYGSAVFESGSIVHARDVPEFLSWVASRRRLSRDHQGVALWPAIAHLEVILHRAFTDPAALLVWLVPRNMTGKIHGVDLRVGGGYRMALSHPLSESTIPGKMGDADNEVCTQSSLEKLARYVERRRSRAAFL